MNPYLELARPADVVIGLIGLLAAASVASGCPFAGHMLESVIVTFFVLFYIVGGNSINDSADADVDRIAHPGRPVPSGRFFSISRTSAPPSAECLAVREPAGPAPTTMISYLSFMA